MAAADDEVLNSMLSSWMKKPGGEAADSSSAPARATKQGHAMNHLASVLHQSAASRAEARQQQGPGGDNREEDCQNRAPDVGGRNGADKDAKRESSSMAGGGGGSRKVKAHSNWSRHKHAKGGSAPETGDSERQTKKEQITPDEEIVTLEDDEDDGPEKMDLPPPGPLDPRALDEDLRPRHPPPEFTAAPPHLHAVRGAYFSGRQLSWSGQVGRVEGVDECCFSTRSASKLSGSGPGLGPGIDTGTVGAGGACGDGASSTGIATDEFCPRLLRRIADIFGFDAEVMEQLKEFIRLSDVPFHKKLAPGDITPSLKEKLEDSVIAELIGKQLVPEAEFRSRIPVTPYVTAPPADDAKKGAGTSSQDSLDSSGDLGGGLGAGYGWSSKFDTVYDYDVNGRPRLIRSAAEVRLNPDSAAFSGSANRPDGVYSEILRKAAGRKNALAVSVCELNSNNQILLLNRLEKEKRVLIFTLDAVIEQVPLDLSNEFTSQLKLLVPKLVAELKKTQKVSSTGAPSGDGSSKSSKSSSDLPSSCRKFTEKAASLLKGAKAGAGGTAGRPGSRGSSNGPTNTSCLPPPANTAELIAAVSGSSSGSRNAGSSPSSVSFLDSSSAIGGSQNQANDPQSTSAAGASGSCSRGEKPTSDDRVPESTTSRTGNDAVDPGPAVPISKPSRSSVFTKALSLLQTSRRTDGERAVVKAERLKTKLWDILVHDLNAEVPPGTKEPSLPDLMTAFAAKNPSHLSYQVFDSPEEGTCTIVALFFTDMYECTGLDRESANWALLKDVYGLGKLRESFSETRFGRFWTLGDQKVTGRLKAAFLKEITDFGRACFYSSTFKLSDLWNATAEFSAKNNAEDSEIFALDFQKVAEDSSETEASFSVQLKCGDLQHESKGKDRFDAFLNALRLLFSASVVDAIFEPILPMMENDVIEEEATSHEMPSTEALTEVLDVDNDDNPADTDDDVLINKDEGGGGNPDIRMGQEDDKKESKEECQSDAASASSSKTPDIKPDPDAKDSKSTSKSGLEHNLIDLEKQENEKKPVKNDPKIDRDRPQPSKLPPTEKDKSKNGGRHIEGGDPYAAETSSEIDPEAAWLTNDVVMARRMQAAAREETRRLERDAAAAEERARREARKRRHEDASEAGESQYALAELPHSAAKRVNNADEPTTSSANQAATQAQDGSAAAAAGRELEAGECPENIGQRRSVLSSIFSLRNNSNNWFCQFLLQSENCLSVLDIVFNDETALRELQTILQQIKTNKKTKVKKLSKKERGRSAWVNHQDRSRQDDFRNYWFSMHREVERDRHDRTHVPPSLWVDVRDRLTAPDFPRTPLEMELAKFPHLAALRQLPASIYPENADWVLQLVANVAISEPNWSNRFVKELFRAISQALQSM